MSRPLGQYSDAGQRAQAAKEAKEAREAKRLRGLEHHAKGLDPKSIATRLVVGEPTVRRWIRETGQPPNKRDMGDEF